MAGIGYKTFGEKIGFPNLQTFADRNRGIAESTTAAYRQNRHYAQILKLKNRKMQKATRPSKFPRLIYNHHHW